MGLLDLLNDVTNGNATPDQHFDHIADHAPRDALSEGIADAFRSNDTPSMGQMVAQMFGQSSAQQQAGVLNQILASVGPAVLSGLAGGALGNALASGKTHVTPDEAARVSPGEVQDVVNRAGQQQPGIADALGRFYAEHSGLVKTLGTAALTIALAKVKQRMSQR
jgi:hypothetical protein